MLQKVAFESNLSVALDHLNRYALEQTNSRNSLIALVNDESGMLELAHGAGGDWGAGLEEQIVKIDIGKRDGIVAYVAATGAPLMTGNVADEPRYRNLFGTTISEIAVPVRDQFGRVRAVLNIESDKPHAYTLDDYELCEEIGLLISMVIERNVAITDQEALIEIGKALDASSDEEQLIERVLHIASDTLLFQACSIFLFDPPRDMFVLKGSVGPLNNRVGEIGYKKGEGCTGWVCEMGEPIRLETNPQKDPRWKARHVEFPSEEVASFLCVPVMYRGRSIGAIRAVRRHSDNEYIDNRFNESDERVLLTIAEQFGLGLEHVRGMKKQIESERMAAWGELSAKSSHMIGNRVFALKGDVNELGHLLDVREPNLNELKSLQRSLSTNVTRVEEILQDFRDFLTATKLDLSLTDLNSLVGETVKEVFPRRSQVQLEVELADGLPEINLDATKFRRAVSELIENSFNYVTEGRMRVATGIATPVEVRKGGLRPARQYVKLEIEDSGPGVTDEKKDLIFQPFFSGRVKGMGLGLSIVKGIVDSHGGGIFEGGKEGQGAKFVILLPVPDRSN